MRSARALVVLTEIADGETSLPVPFYRSICGLEVTYFPLLGISKGEADSLLTLSTFSVEIEGTLAFGGCDMFVFTSD